MAGAPLIVLSNEGSLYVSGLTVQDHFIALGHEMDDSGEANAPLQKFFEGHALPCRRPEQIEAWLETTRA